MPEVRLLSGLRAGEVIVVSEDKADTFVLAGRAERVAPPRHARVEEAAEVPETPEDTVEEVAAEKPKPTPRRRRKSPAAETR